MSTNWNTMAVHAELLPANPLSAMARVKMLGRRQARDDDTIDGTPRRLWAVFVALLVPLCLGLAVMLFCSALNTPARLSDAETVEIYASAIARLVAQDDTFPQPLRPLKIYLRPAAKVRISDAVRHKLAAAIPGSAVVWIDDPDNVLDRRDGTVRGGGVMITLDDIVALRPNHITTLAGLHVAYEAGVGMRYELEKVNGHWVVRRHDRLWIS